jgi:hypothetical protein
MRVMLLALFLCVIPASSWAGVFISVGFAPPVLPVYEQPICPEPGLMWTPGYWAYGGDGYYWVPGAWVPAPYVGALWTPPYWGWSNGLFVFHEGYWGPHVGYYGGVNYGFGYGGIGFAGGMWRGGVFAYNTAVMHVGVGGGWGGRVYEDRVAVDRGFVARDSHVAYSGGPGGINHPPTERENAYSHEQHMGATPRQTEHQNAAMHNTNSYASHNGGHPSNPAMDRAGGGSRGGNTERGGNPHPGGNTAGGGHGNAPGGGNPHPGGNTAGGRHGNAPGGGSHSNTGNGSTHSGGGTPTSHQPQPQHTAPPKSGGGGHGHR